MEQRNSSNEPSVTPLAAGVLAVVALGILILWLRVPDAEQRRTLGADGASDQQLSRQNATDDGAQQDQMNSPDTRAPQAAGSPASSTPEHADDQEAGNDGDPPEVDSLLQPNTEPDADGWYTRQASLAPDQRNIAPDDPNYDPVLEAHQLFFPLEEALHAARPLSPIAYKEVLASHKDTSAEVFTRAGDLLRQGQTEAAKQLLAEWNRLYLAYKDEAYPAQARPRETLGDFLPHSTQDGTEQ